MRPLIETKASESTGLVIEPLIEDGGRFNPSEDERLLGPMCATESRLFIDIEVAMVLNIGRSKV